MELTSFLTNTFLFRGIDEQTLRDILAAVGTEQIKYPRGLTVLSTSAYEKRVGFVLSGKCEVRRKKSDGTEVVLNTLREGDSFGILTIFSEAESFPTEIYTLKNSEIIFFKEDAIKTLMKENADISLNMIRFLTERVMYLNSKIATFSETRVQDKLAAFLLSEYERCGENPLPFNCKKSAEAMNVGRASVYRALYMLEADNYITFDSKKIFINDLKGLERIKK